MILGDDVETILRAITAAGDPWGEDAFPALRRIEAEVERLRAALERVESILRPIASDNPVYERTTAHFDAHGIARAALAKEEA